MPIATLNSDAVHEILLDCLFSDEEAPGGADEHGDIILPDNAVTAEGIINPFAFHRERLESHRDEVKALLNELPDQFHRRGGGGMSFLNACDDRHGTQWTSFHKIMDELFVLGIALGYVKYLLPRPLWGSLPGSVPYIVIDTPDWTP